MSQILKPKKGYKFVKGLFGKYEGIPEEWDLKKIEECCDILDSKRVPINSEERKKIQGNIPYYGANGIQGYVNDYIFDEELILLAEDGGYFEEYKTRPITQYVIGKCWVNNHAHVLSAKNNNSLKWIFYSLVHKNITPYINGSTRTKLNQSDLRQVSILIPPIKEQQKISTILSNVDNLITNTQKIINQTKFIKKGLMQKLLTVGISHNKFKKIKWYFGKEVKIPKEWSVGKLRDYVKKDSTITYGIVQAGSNLKSGISYFRTLDVTKNLVHFNDLWKTSQEISDQYYRTILQKGDLIVTVRASVGVVKLITKEFEGYNLSRGVAKISPSSDVDSIFLLEELKSEMIQKQISLLTNGTTFIDITMENLRNLKIFIPSLQEQQKIASILSNIDSKIKSQIQYKEKLERLKKSLMQKLLTGQVRVKV